MKRILALLVLMICSISYGQTTLRVINSDRQKVDSLVVRNDSLILKIENDIKRRVDLSAFSGGSGTSVPDPITQADYDLLTEQEKNDGSFRFIKENAPVLTPIPLTGLPVNDIGALNKTLDPDDFGKYQYTNSSITLTLDDSPSESAIIALKPINIDSIIYVEPTPGISIIGNGSDIITDGFLVDSLNLGVLRKLYANTYSVDGAVKPWSAGPVIPTIISQETTLNADAAQTIVVNKPTEVSNGNLLLAYVYNDSQTANVSFDATSPTYGGWTFLLASANVNSDVSVGIYYRIADGTEPATFTFNTLGTGWTGNEEMSARIFNIDGVNTADPLGVVGTAHETSANVYAFSITTEADNSLVIAHWGMDGDDYAPLTTSEGVPPFSAIQAEFATPTVPGQGVSIVYSTFFAATTQATDDPRLSSGGTSDGGHGIQIEIKAE